MKAALFVELGRIALNYQPGPEIGPPAALIRITKTTICGTVVHILKGEYPVVKGPTVGHEREAPVIADHSITWEAADEKTADRDRSLTTL